MLNTSKTNRTKAPPRAGRNDRSDEERNPAMSDTFGQAAALDPAASGQVAVVGVGETDYGADYRAARSAADGFVPPDAETLGRRAFERALADSGLSRGDVDGLCASFPYGGTAPEAFAAALGVAPRHIMRGGGMMPFLAAVKRSVPASATRWPSSTLSRPGPSAVSTAVRLTGARAETRTTTITRGGGAPRPPTGP